MLESKEDKTELTDKNLTEETSEHNNKKEETTSGDLENDTSKVIESTDTNEDNVENEKVESPKQNPPIQYDSLSLEELADALEKLISTQQIHQIKTEAEAIKSAFNIKFGTLLAEKKAAFWLMEETQLIFNFQAQ